MTTVRLTPLEKKDTYFYNFRREYFTVSTPIQLNTTVEYGSHLLQCTGIYGQSEDIYSFQLLTNLATDCISNDIFKYKQFKINY